jgi:hypothetical protein
VLLRSGSQMPCAIDLPELGRPLSTQIAVSAQITEKENDHRSTNPT